MGEAADDIGAQEILGNIDAMRLALESAVAAPEITRATVVDIHRRLLADTALREHAGRIREVQNWLGGSAVGLYRL